MKLQELTKEIDVWQDWIDYYKRNVTKFIKEALTKENWQDWEEGVFYEYFEKSGDQCVSSLKQGYFTNEEKERIKENWQEIAPFLKVIAEHQEIPQWEQYEGLKQTIRRFTKNDMRSATNRLIAGLQPKLLSTIVKEESLRELYDYLLRTVEEDIPPYQHNWFKDSHTIAKLFRESLPSKNYMDLITYPWQIFEGLKSSINENMMKEDINKLKVLLLEKKQIILQGPPGTGKTRLAKQIAKELTIDNVEIIQFHPSYTYEDFVRGITIKNNGDGLEYITENKILASIAEQAHTNWTNHHKEVDLLNEEAKLEKDFYAFLDFIEKEIEDSQGFLQLTDNVGLINLDEDAFRYKGKADGWIKRGNRMLFKDIKQAYLDGNKERQDLKKNTNLSGLAKQHASYFVRVLNKFQKFIDEHNLVIDEVKIEKEPLKNYVLIIDEINRANLSSVLGELIYALEYRGEAVDSMYAIDEDRKIVLPNNLFIIGTMNTADRSVGQIDYATRRRFAFVKVLPEDLTNKLENEELQFATESFKKVASIFEKHLSLDFKREDVQLGHSYFIYKKDTDFSIALQYEIKPILHEYIKDGILEESEELFNTIEML